jgi:hypothetical protein
MLHQNSSHTKNHKTSLLLHKYKTYYYNSCIKQPNRHSCIKTAQTHAKNTSCSLMQLFPTTFLSKTAHAAQLPNPHPRYAAISTDFSMQLMQPNKNPHPRYAAQNLMQPTLFPQTFLSKTAHAAQLPNQKQLMQPHAAISNDFSIKNSSCSPTAKSPPSVCSYFYQKQLMQPNYHHMQPNK